MPLRSLLVPQLSIRGERAFQSIGVYAALKRMLIADRFTFRAPVAAAVSPDRVLFLNLTYWNQDDSDVLVDETLDADVLAHAAWHHAARKALARATADRAAPTAAALFLGESVASAFDLYMIGRMLQTGRSNAFLKSQVPAMSAALLHAGLDDDALAHLWASIAEDPDRAFADLRQLLFDASLALTGCGGADDAVAVLDLFVDHRFAGLLHHYELSNWILYARAYSGPAREDDPALVADRALRAAPSMLDWLERNWLESDPRACGGHPGSDPTLLT